MNFEGATSRIPTLTGGRLPPPTDLDGLAEKFKKRGYSPVGINSYRVVLPPKFTLSRVERVTHSVCSFPLFVIPGLTKPASYLIRGNPVFLSLKDQKIALLEQRVSSLWSPTGTSRWKPNQHPCGATSRAELDAFTLTGKLGALQPGEKENDLLKQYE